MTVALLNDKTKVRNVFGAGANFVLYKPISVSQAQASLRAATALLKRERRRAFRVPVQVGVEVRVQNGAEMEGILLDLSEDGMDVLTAQSLYPSAPISAPSRSLRFIACRIACCAKSHDSPLQRNSSGVTEAAMAER